MTKSMEYYLTQIVSAAHKGPFMAEKLADNLTMSIVKQRKAKRKKRTGKTETVLPYAFF